MNSKNHKRSKQRTSEEQSPSTMDFDSLLNLHTTKDEGNTDGGGEKSSRGEKRPASPSDNGAGKRRRRRGGRGRNRHERENGAETRSHGGDDRRRNNGSDRDLNRRDDRDRRRDDRRYGAQNSHSHRGGPENRSHVRRKESWTWSRGRLEDVAGRYLVIIAAGDNSLHDEEGLEWYKDRRFDLAVVYYGSNEEKAARFKAQAKFFMQKEGPKWQLMRCALQDLPWREYSVIWMPDDDLRVSTANIVRMFQIAEEQDLNMGQPALLDVNIQPQYRNIIRERPGVLLHYSNFVEIMCPFFRVDTLSFLAHTFDSNDAKSGWGLDMLWPNELRFQGIAVIDATPVEHTRPQQAFAGQSSFYQRFKIDPRREYYDLQRRFRFKDFKRRTFEEVLPQPPQTPPGYPPQSPVSADVSTGSAEVTVE